MERSPWSGLTASQSLELADALGSPARVGLGRAEALWDVHVAYSRRAAAALVSNDLHGAIRAAEIAAAAQALQVRQVPADVPGERETVVDEHPAAARGAEATPLRRPAHGPDRARLAGSA
jgi:hypothetical protein